MKVDRLVVVAGVRAAYGIFLLARGIAVAPAIVGRPADRGERTLIRALGVRHVAHAAVTLARPGLARPGTLIDASHAASLVGIAAISPRHRRLALTDLPIASAFTAAEVSRPRR